MLIDGWVRPNGNIIVQADGSYNRFDRGVHRHKFEKIKQHYAVGCDTKSRMLTSQEINRLAPVFVETLGSIVGTLGERALPSESPRMTQPLSLCQVLPSSLQIGLGSF